MCAAEGTFDFYLELKKTSSVATILDKNSYTFKWIPCYMTPQRCYITQLLYKTLEVLCPSVI